MTNNLENQFRYVIKATNEKGDVLFLEAYCAGSSPAIGGIQDNDSKEAAPQLAQRSAHSKTPGLRL